jgi:hypothetical protein
LVNYRFLDWQQLEFNPATYFRGLRTAIEKKKMIPLSMFIEGIILTIACWSKACAGVGDAVQYQGTCPAEANCKSVSHIRHFAQVKFQLKQQLFWDRVLLYSQG